MARKGREAEFETKIENFFRGGNGDNDLRAVVARVGAYLRFDSGSGFSSADLGTLFLALLDVSRNQHAFSVADWFSDWVEESLDDEMIQAALHRNRRTVADVVANGGSAANLALSSGLGDVVKQAALLANLTGKSERFGLRHLIAAMMQSPRALRQEWPSLGGQRERLLASLPAFPGLFFDRLREHREQGRMTDDLQRWQAALGIEAVAPVAVIRENLIPGYAADRAGGDGEDSLGVDGDVEAFAKLICLEEAHPPLSIGLFGGWGAGKSTFMERLETEIDALTKREAAQRAEAKTSGDGPRFVTRVTHIWFNAWQYSDANLWASLTTEFFDQLRAGGHKYQGAVLRDKLVQRVKEHVNRLGDSAATMNQALDAAQAALAAAKNAHDVALARARNVESYVLENEIRGNLAKILGVYRGKLEEFGFLAKDSVDIQSITAIADLAGRLSTLQGKIGTLTDAVWKSWLRWPVMIVLAATIAGGLMVIAAPQWAGRLYGWVTSLGVLTLGGLLWRPLSLIGKLVADTAALAAKIEDAKAEAQKKVQASEADLRDKAAAVKDRQAAVTQAETALARYAGQPGTPASPRLLQFLLNDDLEAKHIEGQIGLISRARRLFQAIDKIAEGERGKENPDQEVPERIILYIDDLDRCTYDQVYAVLQAVHLLLAFELFVVVVGVDVAWVEDAITWQLRDSRDAFLADTDRAAEMLRRRKRAITYLEKIFQIPFWLRQLSSEGDHGGSYGRFVSTLLKVEKKDGKTDTVPRPDLAEEVSAEGKELAIEGEGHGQLGLAADVEFALDDADLETALDTVRVVQEEVDFLSSPEIGAIAAPDPRGVKRMINTYRLARARLSRDDLDKLLDTDNPSYPILALFVAIETGQPVEITDAIYRGLKAEEIGATDIDDLWRPLEAALENKTDADAKDLHQRWVAVRAALARVRTKRTIQEVTATDCLPMARLVRRYSFNRLQ